MKTYSFVLVCLTLGIFYSLAVKMEHEKKLESKIALMQSHDSNISANLKNMAFEKSCSKKSEVITSQKISSNHIGLHDDFSMQVTGKQHIYLNTGVSFIEFQDSKNEKENNVMQISGS